MLYDSCLFPRLSVGGARLDASPYFGCETKAFSSDLEIALVETFAAQAVIAIETAGSSGCSLTAPRKSRSALTPLARNPC